MANYPLPYSVFSKGTFPEVSTIYPSIVNDDFYWSEGRGHEILSFTRSWKIAAAIL